MKTDIVIHEKFKIDWLSDDTVCLRYQDDVNLEKDDVKRMLELEKELGVNETTKRIILAGRYTTITSEAREYVEEFKPRSRAEAYVLFGLAQKILFNFYNKARKNKNPMRAFTNIGSAIQWMEQY